jgi:hypothetical protein
MIVAEIVGAEYPDGPDGLWERFMGQGDARNGRGNVLELIMGEDERDRITAAVVALGARIVLSHLAGSPFTESLLNQLRTASDADLDRWAADLEQLD